MDITPRKREKIVTLSEHTTMSQREIARTCGVSQGVVSKIVKRKRETGSVDVKRLGKCGRKRKTTPADDRFLLRKSKLDPRKSSQDLQQDLAASGIVIHDSTVRKRLLESGRRAIRPQKKQLLTERMKKQRLLWAKKYSNWTVGDWKKVLFTDETHFIVQGQRSKFVRKSDNEKLTPSHIDQTVKHPVKKMFWGCFSYMGVGSLVPIEGMMNSQKYKSMLEKCLDKQLQKCQPQGGAILQQDSAPCHKSKEMMAFFKNKKINVLDWPGNSPDLNPIENLWAICKARLRKIDCTTKIKMIEAVIQVWYRDERISDNCQKLIESMPKRVKAVIAAKGGHISY